MTAEGCSSNLLDTNETLAMLPRLTWSFARILEALFPSSPSGFTEGIRSDFGFLAFLPAGVDAVVASMTLDRFIFSVPLQRRVLALTRPELVSMQQACAHVMLRFVSNPCFSFDLISCTPNI